MSQSSITVELPYVHNQMNELKPIVAQSTHDFVHFGRPTQKVQPIPVDDQSNEHIEYHFIKEDGSELEEAMIDIARCPIIAVDCEGVELGRNGTLCLVQIATKSKVYILDVISIGELLFQQGLKFILESTTPTKVFYDCRRDSDILYHQHGVRLRGVLDVALTEVFYRWQNGLGTPRFLKGYKRCVDMYLSINNPHFHQVKEKMCARMTEGDTQFWVQRPLPKDALDYAAYDVKYLRELHFVLMQFISMPNIQVIYGASTKFVGMERDTDTSLYARNSPKWAEISPSLFTIK